MFSSLFQSMAETERSRDHGREPQGGMMYLSGLAPGEILIPECEVIFEDDDEDPLDSKFDWCEKNRRHSKFIPLSDFVMEDLPLHFRTDSVMAFIKAKADVTVLIRIPCTSTDRPDFIPGYEAQKTPYPYMHHKGSKDFTRNGTGCVMSVSPVIYGTCPCRQCKRSDRPKTGYYLVTVRTVTHNVFNDEEAALAIVDLFYDKRVDGDDDSDGDNVVIDDDGDDVVHHLYGIRLDDSDGKKDTMYQSDVCDLVCASHSARTVERISNVFSSLGTMPMPSLPDTKPFIEVIISHPHGCTKRVSVGEVPYVTIPLKPGYKAGELTALPPGITKYRYKSLSSKDNWTSLKQEVVVRPGTYFSLPSDASYTMKYHFGNPKSWYTFPTGTKLVLPPPTVVEEEEGEGRSDRGDEAPRRSDRGDEAPRRSDRDETPWQQETKTLLMIPDYTEFETEGSSILSLPDHHRYYAENIVGACAGTSGAMVYSNLMEDEVLTDMDHTSTLRPWARTCLSSSSSSL